MYGNAGTKDCARGIITDIQRYSVHDGPGIRTVVFFKGCPLRCQWCQNPETNDRNRQIIYYSDLCIGCGKCAKACPTNCISLRENGFIRDMANCRTCGKCVEVCPTEARMFIGKEVSSDEVIQRVIRDEQFYKSSGGGVTLSGGEVLTQPPFAAELLSNLKDLGIHTAIETSGYSDKESFLKVIKKTDLILFDVKHTDAALHKKYTGVDNKRILENLYAAAGIGKIIIIRVPLIPQVNDDRKTLQSIGNLTREINAEEIHVLPFHQMGKSKWKGLQKEYYFQEVAPYSKEKLREIEEFLESLGIPFSIGGGGADNK